MARCQAVAGDIARGYVQDNGNHVWFRAHTQLHGKYERQAEDFAHRLLVSNAEAWSERLRGVGQIAEYFRVPEEKVWLQGRQS